MSEAPQNPFAPVGYIPAPIPAPTVSHLNVQGLVALLLGGISLLVGVTLGWIPFVGILPCVMAIAGIVVGIVGLVIAGRARGLAIAGVIVSACSLLITALLTVAMIAVFVTFRDAYSDLTEYPETGGDSTTGVPGVEVDGDPFAGTIDRPVTVGSVIVFDDDAGWAGWQIVVGAPDLDATDAVLAADPSAAGPAEGHRYVVVPLDYTNLTGNLGYAAAGIVPEVVDGEGVTYAVAPATYPPSLQGEPHLQPGADAQVNAVFEMPDSAAAGSLLRLTSTWGTTAYVVLE